MDKKLEESEKAFLHGLAMGIGLSVVAVIVFIAATLEGVLW